MRESRHDSYQQAYTAQVVVEAEGVQLILAADSPVAWRKCRWSDRREAPRGSPASTESPSSSYASV